MITSLWITLTAFTAHAVGLLIPYDNHDHATSKRGSLPGSWFHSEDHPVHNLFSRATNDGVSYPAVGSPAWAAPFPSSSPDVNSLPPDWVNALNAGVMAGKIPNIPTSTSKAPQTNPVYPEGIDPMSAEVCSGTYKCRNPLDIWDAPNGYMGLGFDDGPQPPTTQLVQFLNANNETATHFMIGVNIINNAQQFLTAFNSNHDIAVHTWTHPYMTTLNNLEVLGQLGWSMELIQRSTGGRVPRFWRPPYGDSDNRVRAIAQYVFGLTTIFWNQDTFDWSMTSPGGPTPDQVEQNMTKWLTGPKTPGLIILEHELSNLSVNAFITAYPLIKSNGWNTSSVVLFAAGHEAYNNAQSSNSNDVTPAEILANSSISSSTSSVMSTSSQIHTSSSSSASTSPPPAAPSEQPGKTSIHSSALRFDNELRVWNSAVGFSTLTILLGFCFI